jgi:hypothetical protein
MSTEIKIGDLIKIINWGEVYPGYETAAKAMKLKNWILEYSGPTKNSYGNIYRVVGVYNASHASRRILGVTNEIEDFVINEIGVELAVKSKYIAIISKEAKTPQLFDINNLYPYD